MWRVRVSAWLRWRIAELLDRLPDVCWAGLARWAGYPDQHPFGEILEMRGTAGYCARHCQEYYCGKCGGR